jgi:hypothetical protein
MPDSPRIVFENQGGMNLVEAPDLLKPGQFCYLQNTRKLLGGRLTARPPLGANLLGGTLAAGVTSVNRLNDPYLPGYAMVVGAAGVMYVNTTSVATGLSGNPLSFLPYRPTGTPRPWDYIADPSLAVTIPSYISAGYGTVAGMLKVRADGLCRKTGIKEPQVAPSITVPSGNGPNWVTYRYVYRDSTTQAISNPSPESVPQIVPQSSVAASQAAASGSTINPNVLYNSSQYQGNSNQIRTSGGVAPGTLTDYVIIRNFSLSVPSGVTIDGVSVSPNWMGQYADTGVIANVALFYQGTILGEAKSPGDANQQTATSPSYGGGSDPWGAIITPAIANDSTFGFGIQILAQSSGGSDRSFINSFTITIYYTSLSSTGTATSSLDPQVDTIDVYRQDPGLDNFTYTLSVPNASPSFTDTASSLSLATNPILSYQNYEPFPSIDLPRAGTCNVAANGAIAWATGDHFNVRWLPGTIVLIGGVAYILYNRPSSTTAMLVYTTQTTTTGFIAFGYPPTGSGVSFQIAAPTLAAQPSPVIWGPTPDNAGSFYFGLDPNNPGDLVWSLGNNFDSASDANRMYVTSPSEMLMNGTVTSELSTVFSTERFWLIYPNFSDAVAAVTGTLGQQWTLVQSASTRGLYMRYAIGSMGSLLGWRAKDGIFVSQGGGPEKEISGQIYNLFPHGQPKAPSAVVIGGNTVYPPDDTKPNAQTITMIPGYLFYNYQDVSGNPRTLVYDFEAKGWSVDVTNPVANCHSLPVEANQILVGCVDGTVRAFDNAGTETGTAIVATGCQNGGSPRTVKRIGGVFLRALAAQAITPQFWANRYGTQITGTAPATLGTNAAEADYLVDFTSATGADVLDLACQFAFPLGSSDWIKEIQYDWTALPQQIVAWRTGMKSYSLDGWLNVPWIRFAYASTTTVNLSIITDQGATITLAVPSSAGVPAKYFSWLPAVVGGVSTKFRLMEWVADAGGAPWTCYAGDIEFPIGTWERKGAYRIIRPFSGEGFGVKESTT